MRLKLGLTWDAVRTERGRRLAACDWTQVPDSPLSDTQKEAWRVYRQQLRDITTTFPAPADVVWPSEP